MEEEKPQRSNRRYIIIIAILLILLIVTSLDDIQNISLIGTTGRGDWGQITTQTVENNCLGQARQLAVSEGYDGMAVLGCSCVAVESDLMKTYDCSINTIDITSPPKKLLVHCYKSTSECTVASELGLDVYTFDELKGLSG
ncbi:hypothetical protein KKF81_06955 [Candidatus Micrarchaeota archaeon]|nr:hypothetical protein [Candidatus Micrarchaeota archaeon]MBU1166669.1 hypothetical protein [Candidatus Micrarchaeota archaeon]MBU1886626.1 hypothetical protein [Candidatus Micrarchaeota archaeon]